MGAAEADPSRSDNDMKWIRTHLAALLALAIALASYLFYDWKRPSLALAALLLAIIGAVMRRKDTRPWMEELSVATTIVVLLFNMLI